MANAYTILRKELESSNAAKVVLASFSELYAVVDEDTYVELMTEEDFANRLRNTFCVSEEDFAKDFGYVIRSSAFEGVLWISPISY